MVSRAEGKLMLREAPWRKRPAQDADAGSGDIWANARTLAFALSTLPAFATMKGDKNCLELEMPQSFACDWVDAK